METKNLRYEELPDNLTVEELRDFLRIGTNKAYEIANEIPHYKGGNRRYFPKEKVKEWTLKNSKNRRQKKAERRLAAL